MNLLDEPPPPADERIPYGPDPLHFGDLRLPAGPGPYPVVLVVHGGFWRNRYDLEHIGHLCAGLTREGLATWSVEYRRIGDAGGGWPGTFHDVAAAAKCLRTLAPRFNLDLGRVVALGHSAGGHLALWLAACGKIGESDPLHVGGALPLTGVVSLAGVCDLRRAYALRLSQNVVETFLGGTPRSVPERYAGASPGEMLPLGVPQVLVHGTDDENVPYSISADYARAAREAGDPVELVTLPRTSHFELIDPASHAWPRVLSAVRSLLDPRTPRP